MQTIKMCMRVQRIEKICSFPVPIVRVYGQYHCTGITVSASPPLRRRVWGPGSFFVRTAIRVIILIVSIDVIVDGPGALNLHQPPMLVIGECFSLACERLTGENENGKSHYRSNQNFLHKTHLPWAGAAVIAPCPCMIFCNATEK